MEPIEPPRAPPLLIFPPGWTAYAPYLALPALAAAARRAGHEVELLDLNVEYYDAVLSRTYLEARLAECRARLAEVSSWQERRRLSAAIAYGYLADQVDEIKARVRDRTGHLHPAEARGLLEELTRALQIAAAPVPGFELLLNRFEVPVDVDSLRDLELGLSARDRNPFIAYYEALIERDPAFWKRDFIGVSVTSETQLLPAFTIAAMLRRRFGRSLHICFGGNFISRFIRLAKEPAALLGMIDSYVIDEGEATFVRLLEAVAGGQDVGDLDGVATVTKSRIRINPAHPLDVDRLPTPDFRGLPLDKYFSSRLILPVYSSRGCFAKCTFCSIPAASGGGFRVRSAEQIVRDMQLLGEAHGTRYFTFIDETLRPAVMRQICDGIAARGLDVRWYGETRFGPQFTESFAQQLHEGGCRKLQFGLESYNQRVLDLMRKGVRQRDIEPTLRALFSKGIAAHLFFMVGFPTETEEEARRTHEFTTRMLRTSQREYGNPYTTRGFGLFSLDPLAPAYAEPERHRILLVLDDDPSRVSQRIDYRSREGLQPEEAQRLVDEFRFGISASTTARGGARAPPGQVFLEEPEELNFLASCWHAERRFPAGESRAAPAPAAPRFDGFGESVRVFEDVDLLSPSPVTGGRLVHTLFSPATRAWMAIDADMYERAKAGLPIAVDASARLQALGFGRDPGRAAVPPAMAQTRPVSFLDLCSAYEADAGRGVALRAHATGQVVNVSALVFLALRLADGTQTLGELVRSLAELVGTADPHFAPALEDRLLELSRSMLIGFMEPRPIHNEKETNHA